MRQAAQYLTKGTQGVRKKALPKPRFRDLYL